MAVINDKVTCMSLSKNLVSPSGSDRSLGEEAAAAAKENCQAKLAGKKYPRLLFLSK